MSEKFVLATHNPGKLKEMSSILDKLGIEVVSPADLGISVEVEEIGETFAENAMLKAKAVCAAAKLPAIGDDSGLCVDYLGTCLKTTMVKRPNHDGETTKSPS